MCVCACVRARARSLEYVSKLVSHVQVKSQDEGAEYN